MVEGFAIAARAYLPIRHGDTAASHVLETGPMTRKGSQVQVLHGPVILGDPPIQLLGVERAESRSGTSVRAARRGRQDLCGFTWEDRTTRSATIKSSKGIGYSSVRWHHQVGVMARQDFDAGPSAVDVYAGASCADKAGGE
jgi:hypothetical protein